jgi:sporulation protein YlmC with PRC-barrel domain
MLRTAFTISAATLLMLVVPATAQQAQTPAQQTQKAPQGGVRTAERMSFYQVREADLRASDLIGLNVYNTNNESIGEIEDLIIDDGDNVRAIVLDVGGFLGIGERRVAVTPASIVVEKRGGELDRAIINATKESLQNAPEFKRQAQAR